MGDNRQKASRSSPEAVAIGSQLFISRHDQEREIVHRVDQMKQSGLQIIRIFMHWDHLEPEEGTWDFTLYDACFRRAEEMNMWVVPTLMAVSPPGWMRRTDGAQDVANLDDPDLWAQALRYVQRVVTHYGSSPALHSWILWNEPSRQVQRDETNLKTFQRFLRRRYDDDIEKLNQLYFHQFPSFDEVGLSEARGATRIMPTSHAGELDWLRFSVSNLNDRLAEIKDAVRRAGSPHPVHTNPHNLARNMLPVSQSPWTQAEFLDFIGCSAHPPWHSTRFPADRVHQSIAYFCDLTRSITPHPRGCYWVSELQGGPTLFSSEAISCPSASDIRHWLWEAVGAGARAVLFWCFNSRKGGYEGGEWSLLNQAGEPSVRLTAARQVAESIAAHQRLFDESLPASPDAYILYSEATMRLSGLEGRGDDVNDPRNAQMAADALCGAYLICADLGLSAGFVHADSLSAESARLMGERRTVLIAAGAYALSSATCEALECFARAGGVLVADGLIGYKDPNGLLCPKNDETLGRLFGAELADILPCPSYPDSDGAVEFPGLPGADDSAGKSPEKDGHMPIWFFHTLLDPKGSEIILDCPGGGIGAVENRPGNGRAIRIATVFFQRYLSQPSPRSLRCARSLLGDDVMNSRLCFLENPSPYLRMRVLGASGTYLAIVMNRGGCAHAQIRFRERGRLIDLADGRTLVTESPHGYRIGMEADSVRLFGFTPE